MKAKKKITLAISVPKGWSELSASQVARVATQLQACADPCEMAIKLATEFAGLSPRGIGVDAAGERVYFFYHRTTGNVALNVEQIAAITGAMKWLTDGAIAPMAAPVLDGYITPDDKLRNATLEQFITADVAYSAYASKAGIHALRVLAASIYARPTYNPSSLEKDTARIARLDRQLYGVFLWFTGIKAHLSKQFPNVFGGDGSGDAPSGGEYLLGTISSLNGGDVTKNEQIKALNLYEALYELDNKIKASRKDV